MGTTHHIRQTGATTVKRNGKIIGNIGAGKSHVPTASKTSTPVAIQHIQTVEKKSELTTESALTIYHMTENQTKEERVEVLHNVYHQLNDKDKEKFVTTLIEPFYKYPYLFWKDDHNAERFFRDILSDNDTPKHILKIFKHYEDESDKKGNYRDFGYSVSARLRKNTWWRKGLNKFLDALGPIDDRLFSTPKRKIVTVGTAIAISAGAVAAGIGAVPVLGTVASGVMIYSVGYGVYQGGKGILTYIADRKSNKKLRQFNGDL